jgi:hypothetical protein
MSDLSDTWRTSVTGVCQNNNKTLSSTRKEEFLDHLTDYKFLKRLRRRISKFIILLYSL